MTRVSSRKYLYYWCGEGLGVRGFSLKWEAITLLKSLFGNKPSPMACAALMVAGQLVKMFPPPTAVFATLRLLIQ